MKYQNVKVWYEAEHALTILSIEAEIRIRQNVNVLD